MMLFRSLFLVATAFSFSLAASHDRLLQLESCDGKIVTLFFNFFVELNVTEGCEGDDLKAIGGYIEEGIDSLIGYIPWNKDFIEANVCPVPEFVPSEGRFLQVAGKYSYSGGGKCLRCVTNKRLYGGRRNLQGTNNINKKTKTQAGAVDTEPEKKLKSDVEALNRLKLEMTKLNGKGKLSSGQTFSAEIAVEDQADEELKYGMTIEMGNLVVLAGLIVKMLPGNLLNKYGLENNGCLDKEPDVNVKVVLMNEASKLTDDDCDMTPDY